MLRAGIPVDVHVIMLVGTTGGSSFMANGGANRSDNLWSARGHSTMFVC